MDHPSSLAPWRLGALALNSVGPEGNAKTQGRKDAKEGGQKEGICALRFLPSELPERPSALSAALWLILLDDRHRLD